MKRIALLSVLAATFVACGGGTPPADAPRKLRFAVIPKSLDIPVFDYAKIGAERAAKQLGNVEVIWRGPETGDQLKQKEILESFITQRVDGIAISCLNGDFLTETINRAMDAGIPVVTWDADAPNSKRIAFYGVDDKAGGRIMGEEAVKLLGGKGTVALMTSLGPTNLQRRLDGVTEVLAQASGHQDHRDLRRQGRHRQGGGNHRHGIESISGSRSVDLGWRLAGFHAQRARPRSQDHARDFLRHDSACAAAPQGGQVQILIGQKYFGWGEEPVKMLAAIKAGKMPTATVINSGVDIVRADNVDAYIAEFKRLEEAK